VNRIPVPALENMDILAYAREGGGQKGKKIGEGESGKSMGNYKGRK
jgi:hypothetical protein